MFECQIINTIMNKNLMDGYVHYRNVHLVAVQG
jgi:hypothetical protein